jgi:hypothetical protein
LCHADYDQPIRNAQQDAKNVSGSQTAGGTAISFARKIVTGNATDFDLTSGAVALGWDSCHVYNVRAGKLIPFAVVFFGVFFSLSGAGLLCAFFTAAEHHHTLVGSRAVGTLLSLAKGIDHSSTHSHVQHDSTWDKIVSTQTICPA